MGYEPGEIEPKWQRYWEEHKTFRAKDPGEPGFDPNKPKFYVLDMFPYPSGAGLHIGHPEGYTATDIVARYKRMCGFNVLHPMGWDAFGLPAEQYAIETGTHPAVTTRRNIETIRRQIKSLGLAYDWDREIDTTDPSYYRWTQWIFLKMYGMWYDEEQDRARPIEDLPIPPEIASDPVARCKYADSKRLAYMAEVPVWWCEKLGTVLADEEVIDGRSERGDHPCVRIPLRQWMLRITCYAERLLKDLDLLDWPEPIKKQQRDWIGRSEGADIEFPLAEPHSALGNIRVFTTRPDTLFGATYMVLAPEHPLVRQIVSDERRAEVMAYVEASGRKSDLARTDMSKEKTGVFTGAYAYNPAFEDSKDPRAKIPIWIADYVLISYGTGAIMAVPAHDTRDWDFAVKYGLPIVEVVKPPEGYTPSAEEKDRRFASGGREIRCFVGDGTAVNSPIFDGRKTPEAKKAITAWLEARGLGRARVAYRLRDWIFSRQRYWGEPFPILFDEWGNPIPVGEDKLPVTLPEMSDFRPSGRLEPPLARAKGWVEFRDPETGRKMRRETNTMPQWAGSCWYYLRYIDARNGSAPWAREKEKYWMPVDLYVGGAEHAVLHLLYARFWHKVLYDAGLVSTKEPFRRLFNQGLILAFAYQDGRGALVPSDEVEERGGKFVRKNTGEELNQIVAKMSKSLRNVVNPDEVVRQYGADTLRLYEMFMGPLDCAKPWNPRDIVGVNRFLHRVWRLYVGDEAQERSGKALPHLLADGPACPAIEKAANMCIKEVTEDIEKMAFNTAISEMMKFVNAASASDEPMNRSQAERFLLVLSPFAPHIAEELWSRMGHAGCIADEKWPEYDPEKIKEDTIEIPIQVNGKVRSRVSVRADAAEEDMRKAAETAVAAWLEGKSIIRTVIVPGRLVNIVVR